jgi:hypothetical protein
LALVGISGKHPNIQNRPQSRNLAIINERSKKLRDLDSIILEIEKNRIQMEELAAKAKILEAASKFNVEEQKKQALDRLGDIAQKTATKPCGTRTTKR